MNRRVFFNHLLNVTAGAAAATFAIRLFPDPTAAANPLPPLNYVNLDLRVQPLYNDVSIFPIAREGYCRWRSRYA
jgi:hypothetical protein